MKVGVPDLRRSFLAAPPCATADRDSESQVVPRLLLYDVSLLLVGTMHSGIDRRPSVAAVVPMARRRAWLQVMFFFPILIGISAVGNAQALMVAWLVWGAERRSGPLWIALAASLKAVPILFAIVYIGRRQWGAWS